MVTAPRFPKADLQDPPEGFVQNYCLLIGDRSFNNFQKVHRGRVRRKTGADARFWTSRVRLAAISSGC